MKKLLSFAAILLFAALSHAAVETTTITGKVLLPSGAPVTAGSITATLSTAGTAPDGASFVVVSSRVTATIASDGTVSVVLVPNDVISPVDTYYIVKFSATTPTSASWTENWTVVTTPDPIALGAVARPNTPPGLTAPISFVLEEGVSLPRRTKLNFLGAGSTCVDNPGQSRVDCTITSGISPDDTAYDATSWDGVTTIPPTKNAIRDKIESMAAGLADDTSYDATTWNANTNAPTKNAVRDKVETLFSLDSAAQTVANTGQKFVTMMSNSVCSSAGVPYACCTGSTTGTCWMTFKRLNTTVGDWTMDFQNSNGVSRFRVGGTAVSGATGTRPWAAYDTSTACTAFGQSGGTGFPCERTYVGGTNGSLFTSDTSTSCAGSFCIGQVYPVNAPTPWTANNTHAGTETFNGAVTTNAGNTFNTVAPVFSNVSPTFATTSSLAQGFVWPTASAGTNIKQRSQAQGVIFGWCTGGTGNCVTPPYAANCACSSNGQCQSNVCATVQDNVIFQSYNTNLTGQRDDNSQHAVKMQLESDYQFAPTAGSKKVEWNIDYIPPGTASLCTALNTPWTCCTGLGTGPTCGGLWRALGWNMDVASNGMQGDSQWSFIPNNLNGGNNRSMEILFPSVTFNRSAAIDNYGDAGVSSFLHLANWSAFQRFGNKSVVSADQASTFSGVNVYAHGALFDFSPGSKTSGTMIGFGVPQPVAPGASSTVENLRGFWVEDLGLNRTGLTNGDAFRSESQTVTNGNEGNVVVAGTGYNHGHYVIGSTHFWEYPAGTIRFKNGAPTADGDGTPIGVGSVLGTGAPATSELVAYTDTTGLSIKPSGITRSGTDTAFPGAVAVPATKSVAITSGCTLDTGVTCPASASEGGFIELPEDSDLGTSKFKLKVGDSNLSADVECQLDANGHIPDSCVGNGVDDTGGGGGGSLSGLIHENIASPGAATTRILMRTTQAINIDSIYAALTGTTSSTWDLVYARAADASTVGQVIGTDAVTSSTAGVSVTATAPLIPKDAYLWYKASAVSGSPSNIFVQVAYSSATATQCSDGVDNDGANGIDYPADAGCSSASDTVEGSAADVTAPEAIAGLSAGTPTATSCVLSWTAPHEDGAAGGAVTSYDCRVRAGTTFVAGDFAAATALTGEPGTPASPGAGESFTATIPSATPSTAYAFACKSQDEVPNVSVISAAASCTTTSGATADLLNDTFNNATNYDDGLVGGGGGWTETVNSAGTNDPNETTLCSALTGFGTGFTSECYQSNVTSSSTSKAWIYNDLGVAQTAGVWQTIYFAYNGMTAGNWADGETRIVTMGNNNAASVSCGAAAFCASLVFDADGAFTGAQGASPACSSPATNCWRMEMKIGGTTTSDKYFQVRPDTVYRLRFMVNNTSNTGEAYLDSTQTVGATTCSGTPCDPNGDLRYIWLGQPENSTDPANFLYDGETASTVGYVP